MLKGTHGTSRSRADSILKAQGFKSSAEGRAGAGVYFWYYSVCEEAAYVTAQAWWHFAYTSQEFKKDEDPSCAVLHAEIDKENAVYLDLTKDEYREKLIALAYKQNCISREQVSALIAFFIDKLEMLNEEKYTLVKLFVPVPPPKGKDVIFKFNTLFPDAPSLIIRHEKHELITNIKLMKELKG